MKRTILGVAEAGEPLLQQTLQAVRAQGRHAWAVSPLIDSTDLQACWLFSVECRLDLAFALGHVVQRGGT